MLIVVSQENEIWIYRKGKNENMKVRHTVQFNINTLEHKKCTN